MTTKGWRGLNHLALVTPDMDATVRFWHGVLGAELVSTLATPDMRHYFFRIGEGSTVAFIEYGSATVTRVEKSAGVFDPREPQLDHISLDLADDVALVAMQQRLRDAGCEVTEVVDHVVIHSIYFTDPNGIALEASCWLIDPTTAPVDYDGPLFSDPDPVPAVLELRSTGTLSATPTTQLVPAAESVR
ncbi:MAG TPA: VOC family protein [Sporichthya sp.]|jgi:catechol 2,3-dioxygenase-like lactoylglutathione lyase family enzyme|nr:VOC family protein [Sporichthya sp.]